MTMRSALKPPAEGAHRGLLAGDPAAGQARGVAVVVQRDDPAASASPAAPRGRAGLDRGDRVGLPGADGEAVAAIVRLGPPAVEDREVQAAVEQDLLAEVPLASCGRAGCSARRRRPGPGARDVHVVVLDEDDPAANRSCRVSRRCSGSAPCRSGPRGGPCRRRTRWIADRGGLTIPARISARRRTRLRACRRERRANRWSGPQVERRASAPASSAAARRPSAWRQAARTKSIRPALRTCWVSHSSASSTHDPAPGLRVAIRSGQSGPGGGRRSRASAGSQVST
jgi:hypothetical protein